VNSVTGLSVAGRSKAKSRKTAVQAQQITDGFPPKVERDRNQLVKVRHWQNDLSQILGVSVVELQTSEFGGYRLS
jgi:hypothetical protein